MRQTKIIATVGPASERDDIIRALVGAGVDVFRLNFSHGTHDSHRAIASRIRRAAADAGRPVAILQDLSGPKIRTGRLRDGQPITLQPGDALTIEVGDFLGEPGRVATAFASLPGAVQRGASLLLDDGRIQLRVESATDQAIQTVVIDGGELGERKGINAPDVELPVSGLTSQDVDDLRFGAAIGVDFVALSFVQQVADVDQARAALRDAGTPEIPVIAKIERPRAVSLLSEILRVSDAVMVARGDLGLELPFERVPRVQKQATSEARSLGIPVIVATQVLESMRTELRPTRAEVSDAANAVDDRVDAIMLAGETAIGAHPVRAVDALDRIIRDAELLRPIVSGVPPDTSPLPPHGTAICEAALTLAERASASAIVAITRGGKTARALSARRPDTPIVAVTDNDRVARRLTLSWGVLPIVGDLSGDADAMAARVGRELLERHVLNAGSTVVLVSVTPDLAPGPSNFVKLHRVQG